MQRPVVIGILLQQHAAMRIALAVMHASDGWLMVHCGSTDCLLNKRMFE